MASNNNGEHGDLPPPQGERHELKAETELRLEIPHNSGGSVKTCTLVLHRGSCELYGQELARNHPYALIGGSKLALFTWHGCVIDVDYSDKLDISYTSDETNANVAFVNTHAQLEALRDEALNTQGDGPRVMIVGPPESGKTSLAKVLVAYATKLGRTPIWVDLDPSENSLSVPGTIACTPMTLSAISVETFAFSGIPPGSSSMLVQWYGSTNIMENVDLYKAQVSALASKIDLRLQGDVDARTSGIIVNTNGWIQDDGYQLLLHSIDALRISVVLILGHDRLYSMMNSHIQKEPHLAGTKIIKLPRSGGVVSRDAAFRRQSRSLFMKRYFYGGMMLPPSAQQPPQQQQQQQQQPPPPSSGTPNRIPQLTPSLCHVAFSDITLYKFSSVSLSASLLPVAGIQSTESVQLTSVKITEKLQHSLLAVCHPASVKKYQESGGRASELYEAGVAGFVSVERVVMETETLHLLSPCAGSLPSSILLVGDITWME